MNVEKHTMKEATEEQKADENYTPEYETYREDDTLNSMVPIWKKSKGAITNEEYNNFYKEKFFDFEDSARVIHTNVEGVSTYNALLYIPAKAPFNYYTREYEKGLQLYSSGVLIMDKCADLLPDYFSFVKGLVDSQDLSLNISREMLQHDRQLKAIAARLEKKIKSELLEMLNTDRENYEKFFENFGLQLKFGAYNEYGQHKDVVKELLMFYSSSEKKLVTLSEYVSRMKEEQKFIYYACGESIEKLDKMPQTELLKDKNYEILYCTAEVDEFAIKMLGTIEEKEFRSVSSEDLGIEESTEEKEAAEKQKEENKDLFDAMKEALAGKVSEVRVSQRLKSHPVCLSSSGDLSIEMEKVLNSMPTANEKISAEKVLEINANHKVFHALKDAFTNDKDKVKVYSELLYNQALLIEGLSIEDPIEFSNAICNLM
jgi:molecular chaperone HtpG